MILKRFLVCLSSICFLLSSECSVSFQSHLFNITNDLPLCIRENRLFGSKPGSNNARPSVEILGNICESVVFDNKKLFNYENANSLGELISMMIYNFCKEMIKNLPREAFTYDFIRNYYIKEHNIPKYNSKIIKDKNNITKSLLPADDNERLFINRLIKMSSIDYAINEAANYLCTFNVYWYLEKAIKPQPSRKKPIVFAFSDLHYPYMQDKELSAWMQKKVEHKVSIGDIAKQLINIGNEYPGREKIVAINGDVLDYRIVSDSRNRNTTVLSFIESFIKPLVENGFFVIFGLGNHEIFKIINDGNIFFVDFMKKVYDYKGGILRDAVVLVNSGRVFSDDIENKLWLKKFRSIYIDSLAIFGDMVNYKQYPGGVFVDSAITVLNEINKFSDDVYKMALMHMERGKSSCINAVEKRLNENNKGKNILVLGHVHSNYWKVDRDHKIDDGIIENMDKIKIIQPLYDIGYFKCDFNTFKIERLHSPKL